MSRVRFNRIAVLGDELTHVAEAVRGGHIAAEGPFARRCEQWLEERTGVPALLTPSCTAALDLAMLVAGIGPGDEVVMPAWTFVSTANAVALRGATPVWADVEPSTLNLDPRALEAAVTERTRAVVVVHYGGVGADMDAIAAIATRHGLLVVEDAAHAIGATRGGRPLGAIAPLGALSFDEMKNVTCGEGGALLSRDAELRAAAEQARLKGTNRAAFLRGEVPEYTWIQPGSSWAAPELSAAFLWGQLPHVDAVNARRREVWAAYREALEPYARAGTARLPDPPPDCEHNGHVFWLVLPSRGARDRFIARTDERGVTTPFHYVPLDGSPAGGRLGRPAGALDVTAVAGAGLVRLPLWFELSDEEVAGVIDTVRAVLDAGV